MKSFVRFLAVMLAVLFVLPALAETPNIPYATEDRLAEAANVPGGTLVFVNPADAAVWPMIPAEEDGLLCLMSTNGGVDISESAVYTTVAAQAGDALAFTFKTDTEPFCDMLELRVNGETVKLFSGLRDWTSYAWAFPEAGVYEVGFAYVKDDAGRTEADAVYLREIAHLTGEEAAAAIAANPVYPTAAEPTLTVTNEGARRIVFEDPTFALTGLFGFADFWIVPGAEAQLLATLAEGTDPEGASFRSNYSAGDGAEVAVTRDATNEGYAFVTPIDTLSDTGYAYTQVSLYPAVNCGFMDVRNVVCFVGEEGANAFVEWIRAMGYGVAGWSYAEQEAAAENAGVSYGLTFIDQQGEFLPGVTVTITAEGYADTLTSDVEGGIVFTAPAGLYEVRIVLAPEGYTFDAERVWILDAEGGDAIVDLRREGE